MLADDLVLHFVRERTLARSIPRVERLASLWGGYGELVRAHLEGAPSRTAIVKCVRPPRGRDGERSHARKVRSYEVERAFYEGYAGACDEGCRVPRLLGASRVGDARVLVLEDLDAAGFEGRCRRSASRAELEACLAWLARFHARFVSTPPRDLWLTGTYWYLATRPDELEATSDGLLRSAARELDARLEAARYKTLVHGDAKEANFCFARTGREGPRVAAVDFQYVGGGVGVRDVAYLLSGGSAERAGLGEDEALERYFEHLRAALAPSLGRASARELELEWRTLYPLAWADFQRFLAGWSPAHALDEGSHARLEAIVRSLV